MKRRLKIVKKMTGENLYGVAAAHSRRRKSLFTPGETQLLTGNTKGSMNKAFKKAD